MLLENFPDHLVNNRRPTTVDLQAWNTKSTTTTKDRPAINSNHWKTQQRRSATIQHHPWTTTVYLPDMTTDNEKTNLDGNGKNNTIIWSKFLIFILHVQAWRRAFHVCVCVQFPIADGYDERLHLSEFGLEKCMHPFDVHELTMSWTANSLWNLMQPDSQSSKFLNSLMLLEIFQIPGSTTMDQQQWTSNRGPATVD